MSLGFPLITVYMPTHNRLSNLKRAVKSVLNQSYQNWQLIIVNDGSSDGTKNYLEHLALTDNRIYIFNNDTPKGACIARNIAINAATGEFITGLDDDDEFTPDRLSYFLKSWKYPYTSLCTPVTICKRNKQTVHRYFIGDLTIDDLLVINKVGNQLFCKTTDLKEINGFDPMFKAWQDYDTWLRFFEKNGRGKKLPESTYLQYEEANYKSITRSPNRLIGFRQFLEKHQSLMSNKQKNAMFCWEAIISGKWVSLKLLLKSHRDIYKYALLHNIKKIFGYK